MRKASAVIVSGLAGAILAGAAQADSPATGTWLMENGKVTVHVAECGPNLCGTIVGLKKPLDKKGRPKRDKENPNPALRHRPVIGLTILSNMKPDGNLRWKGTIYNPDDGNTYASRMKMQSDTVMKVEGCVAGILCKAMKFTRLR